MSVSEHAYDRNRTWTTAEVRPVIETCIRERAMYLGCMYKVMPKELFDLYAKRAMWEYGKLRKWTGPQNEPQTMVDFLGPAIESIGSTIGRGIVDSVDSERAVLTYKDGCALADGWREMGLSDEEVDYLCKVACYCDMGQADGFGLDCSFDCTMTEPGCDICRMILTRRSAE